MMWESATRTFKGELGRLPNKPARLAVVEVDCGEQGISRFKLTISKNIHDRPKITLTALKASTGEYKRASVIAIPIVGPKPRTKKVK